MNRDAATVRSPDPETPRAEQRRAQLLAAAADCFRRNGFHGASIAQISKAAGMSAGHIYHYYANKEAIIAAIVEQQVARVLTLTAAMRAAADVRAAMLAGIAEGIAEHLDAEKASLRLEIHAEAARNPAVARIVRDADARARAGLIDTLRQVRTAGAGAGGGEGEPDAGGDADLAALAEVIATLFEGLEMRAVRHPELDRARLAGLYRRLIDLLLTGPLVDGEAADA